MNEEELQKEWTRQIYPVCGFGRAVHNYLAGEPSLIREFIDKQETGKLIAYSTYHGFSLSILPTIIVFGLEAIVN